MYAVFALAVVWGIYNQPWRTLKSAQPVQEETDRPDKMTNPRVAAAAMAPSVENHQRDIFVSEWTIDPFRSAAPAPSARVPVVITEEGSAPILQGTMLVGSEPVCVIGGQILRKGDRIGDWRIEAVASTRVDIVRLSDQRHLTLRAGEGADSKGR